MSGGNARLRGRKNGGVCHDALLGGQMGLREVTEDGLKRPGQQLVVSDLVGPLASLSQKLREMIFDGETARNGCSFAQTLTQHYDLLFFFENNY